MAFQHFVSDPNAIFIEAIYDVCMNGQWGSIWFVNDIIVLILGVLANAILLWLFLRERKSLSASQVLGMNLVVMNLTYLTIIPVSIISRSLSKSTNDTRSKGDVSSLFNGNQSSAPSDNKCQSVREIFNMFILVGTPLLLTCMCIERHLAVSRPVTYMKMRERKYRVMVSAVVWAITGCFCVCSVFINDSLLILPIFILIGVLFVVMLACLGSMVWSLWYQSPVHHSSLPNQNTHTDSPQKRQAVQSLLIVVASAIVVYFPVLALFPLILYIYYNKQTPIAQGMVCNVLESAVLFPCFGVLIGPLFFFSKAKQLFRSKTTSKSGSG